ncbi:capsule assembly Wzi family protein [bacterium]|nr:capsule assembly Wzi family protein [bacterium]
MISCKKILRLLLWAAAGLLAGTAPSVNVPMDYWGYAFLERMESRGLIFSHQLYVRPLSRVVFADLLRQAAVQAQQKPELFSRTEKKMLDQLQGDFFDELNPAATERSPERHLLTWREKNSRIHVDLHANQTILSNRGHQYQPDALISETSGGGILRGTLNQTVGFYLDARNTLTRGNQKAEEHFDPSQGAPVVIAGSNVYQDQALAYWTWQNTWLRIQAGRDEIAWGPGFHGGLSLSGNSPAAELLRLNAFFRRFSFSYVHAFLRSNVGSKYLAGHRLDFMVKPGLYLGATETVVYGGRDVQFAYLNPIMPIHIAQHHLGDRDNKTMSLDLTCMLWPGLKLYGEYFIDDMTSTESLTRYFGNKFAFLLGGQLINPLRIADTDLRFEYARVEPYVYSHYDSINIYTHYNQLIGHWLGPNADGLFLQLGWQPLRDFRIELSLQQQRKGEGDADTRSRPEQGVEKKFLSGVVERQKIFGINIREQVYRDFFVSVHYQYADVRNVQRRAGMNSFDHSARFELYLNY